MVVVLLLGAFHRGIERTARDVMHALGKSMKYLDFLTHSCSQRPNQKQSDNFHDILLAKGNSSNSDIFVNLFYSLFIVKFHYQSN